MDDTEVVSPKGEIITSGDEIDRAYMERLETLILDRGLIERARDLKLVYTPIHGTGGVIVKPMLRKIGLNFSVVPEQDQFDGRFPTVKSPNPENAEALKLGHFARTKTECLSRRRDRSGLRPHGSGSADHQLAK
jgi:phosphomannomutase